MYKSCIELRRIVHVYKKAQLFSLPPHFHVNKCREMEERSPYLKTLHKGCVRASFNNRALSPNATSVV